jgi:competence protein ComEC
MTARQSTLALAIVVALWTAVAIRAADSLQIYVIDVEGGLANLIIAPSGQSMLIDAGSPPPPTGERDSKRIAAAMQAAGLQKIDFFFSTHYDVDHLGGVPAADKVAHFSRFFDHGELDPAYGQNRNFEQRYGDYVAVSAGKRTVVKPGDMIPLTGVRVEVVSAAGQVLKSPINRGGPNPLCAGAEVKPPDKSENSRSAGILLAYQRFTMVNVGDLTWDGEMALACPVNMLGKIDLYIATHHGFWNDLSGATAHIDAMQPQVVIAPNGARKALAPPAYERIMKIPGLLDLWQLHRAEGSDSEHNVAEDKIANLDSSPEHQGYWMKVVVQPGGAFTVTNSRNNFSKTYKER